MGFKRSPLRVPDNKVTNAAEITLRQSILPLCLVTILFFLWGFAYGLLDVLNKHFQVALDINRAKSSGLQAAYFGAYPVASLTFAGWTLRKFGYKATFILGLSLYGIGALLFWPSGVYRSFAGFCCSTFVIGMGLGSLETAANPYLAVCGPPKYSELRLNLAQAFQAIGTVVGPVLASQVFFKNVNDKSLKNVQYVYLGIAIFVFCLAIVFYFSPIPEITDSDMQAQATVTEGFVDKPLIKHYTLWWGAGSQFCYVGAQVAIAGAFVNYVLEVRPWTSKSMAANYLAIAQGCFAIGRFSGSGLMKFILPRKVFLLYYIMIIAFISAAYKSKGNAGLATLTLVLFFESICFPTTFTLGIRGLGRHTKRGGSIMVASIVGGAVVPPILFAVADHYNNTGKAMFVPLIFFLIAISFAFGVNFHPRTRSIMDEYSESEVGVAANPTIKTDDVESAVVVNHASKT